VLTAKDGLDALAKLGQQGVDLVVTDVNMPRMDGFTLISTIRSQQNSRRIPIIVLSTEASPKDQQAGLSRGADLYLTKPVRPADLVAHVRSLLT
jgi:two-component system chemotaxis response regulator CheY